MSVCTSICHMSEFQVDNLPFRTAQNIPECSRMFRIVAESMQIADAVHFFVWAAHKNFEKINKFLIINLWNPLDPVPFSCSFLHSLQQSLLWSSPPSLWFLQFLLKSMGESKKWCKWLLFLTVLKPFCCKKSRGLSPACNRHRSSLWPRGWPHWLCCKRCLLSPSSQ